MIAELAKILLFETAIAALLLLIVVLSVSVFMEDPRGNDGRKCIEQNQEARAFWIDCMKNTDSSDGCARKAGFAFCPEGENE